MKQRTLFSYIKAKARPPVSVKPATRLTDARAGASTRAGSAPSCVDADADVDCDCKAASSKPLCGLKRARPSITDCEESTVHVITTTDSNNANNSLIHTRRHSFSCENAVAQCCSSVWLADLLTEPAWRSFLQPLLADNWQNGLFLRIEHFLDELAARGTIVYPPRQNIFSAFNSVPFDQLKVVLLGQDPYHGPNQAHGLCFSVRSGTPPPPSLVNMYKELANDIPGFCAPRHGYLQSWAQQGMLMLNASLTVSMGAANSHSKCGWQSFTDGVIRHISQKHPNRVVFLLWGNFARKKKALIDCDRHVVIENAHPSPLSANLWWNCKCFSKCNDALCSLGHSPMRWQLPMQV